VQKCIQKGVLLFFLVIGNIFGTLVFNLSGDETPSENININSVKSLRLPSFFSDHMVFQRDVPVPIWGWGTKNSEVTVQFSDQSHTTTVDENGKWMLSLSPIKANLNGKSLIVSSSESKTENPITLEDILVGEVWICSGQSNMEFTVNSVLNAKDEIANANFPSIRHIKIPRESSFEPQDDVKSSWQVCSPQTVKEFTAVGYFFGRELYQTLNVPIGLISSNWGGTPAESWTNLATLQKRSDSGSFEKRIEDYRKPLPKDNQEDFNKLMADWKKLTGESGLHTDTGRTTISANYQLANFDDSKWSSMILPNNIENDGLKIDGAIWFRKSIQIPQEWIGQELLLSLGPIDDFDVTYWNGEEIGKTGDETPDSWKEPRLYSIPASQNNSNTACIAIRVFDRFGGGGLTGNAKDLRLSLASTPDPTVDLSGKWSYKVSIELPEKPQKSSRNMGWLPSGLFNSMIHPLIPYAFQGAIWYQGESNAGRAHQYRTLFPEMIQCWREAWKKDFPFYFVQLANFQKQQIEPKEDSWAELREAQLMTLKLPKTGQAVSIDIGEAKDIHPKNKQDVGKRLSLIARHHIYGEEELVFSGPIYKNLEIQNEKAIVHFEHFGSGLTASNMISEGKYTLGKPNDFDIIGFSIAGEDHNFVWAKAKITDKNTLEVWSPEVKNPVAVRYAWHTNPICNLYNLEGLPASPFRTDDWDGITVGKE
jgi:sialate O-acetylesterase